MTDPLMTTSIEEALRSGAVRLVGKPDIEALVYCVANAKLGEGPSVRCEGPTSFEKDVAREWVRRVLSALSAFPDHTPALLALIEERDRLKVERDFWENRENEALKRALAAEAKCDALREALRGIHNCGQSAEPDHWKFRCMARDTAARALTQETNDVGE